jgi:hypothetical protein
MVRYIAGCNSQRLADAGQWERFHFLAGVLSWAWRSVLRPSETYPTRAIGRRPLAGRGQGSIVARGDGATGLAPGRTDKTPPPSQVKLWSIVCGS